MSDSVETIYTDYSQGGGRLASSDIKNPDVAPISWNKDRKSSDIRIENTKLAINNIFPNPTSSNFLIGFFNPTQQDVSLDLIDISGRTISLFSKEKLEKGVHSNQVNTKILSPGVYVLKLYSDSEIITSKIVVNQ